MITEHGATHRHALEEALGQVAHYALYHGDLDTIIPIPVIIPEHPHTRREWKTHLRKAVCHCLPRVVGYGHHAHLNIAIAVKVNVSFGIIGGRKPIGKGFSDTIAPIVSKEHRIVNPALIISYVIIYSPKNMWTGWIGLPIQDIATVRCNDKFRIPFAIGIEVRRPYPTRINFDSPDARARARPGRAHVVAEPAEGAGNEATTGGGIVNAGDENFHFCENKSSRSSARLTFWVSYQCLMKMLGFVRVHISACSLFKVTNLTLVGMAGLEFTPSAKQT